ncbi:hypothetical protein BC829DRAFT_380861 [Chytridium lagenaria]|nr:hypothetical protein BC829DRAFT_380861 [Chytridium lagenaria]
MEADFKVIKEANAMQITTIMQKLADSEAEKGAMMADFQVIEEECHALTKASELTRTSHAADIMRLEQVSKDLAESFDHRTALLKKDAAFELETVKESFDAEKKIFFDQIAMLNNALEESSKTHEQARNFHQLELLAAEERAEASEVARDEVMMSHAIELDRMRKEIIKLTDENTSFMAKFNALSVDFNEERRKWEVEKLASSNKLADMRSEITGLLQAHNEEQKTSANLLATLSQEVKHREKEVAEIRKIIADKVLRLRTVLESTNLIDRNERATTRMATRMETIDRPNPSLQAKVTAPTSTGALVDKTVAENRNLFSAKNLINWPKNMQAHVPSAAEPLDGRNINLVAAAGTERSFKGVGSTSTFQRQPYGAAFIGRREVREGDRVTDLSESTNDAALNGDNKKPDIEFLEETTSATVIQNGQSTHEAALMETLSARQNGVPIDVWESTTEAQWNIAKSSNQTFATAGSYWNGYLNFADEMDEALLPVKIQGTTKKVSQNTKPAKILREPLWYIYFTIFLICSFWA